ncbi:MAG: tetratricopeptide repeat protein [Gemmatimonadales bacterium]
MHTPDLTPELVARLQERFEAALECDAAGREQLLARLRETDPLIAERVAGLLAAHQRTDSWLETPGQAARMLGGVAADPVGGRVGPYRIVRVVGEGGMGVVYEAVRDDDQYQARVAVKLLHRHAGSESAMARFRRERQILARLRHRNIATLHDGGVTAEGRPYFVMELVDGEPLTRYADTRRLGVAARIALFQQVLAAVQYAHQSLVVHRDLKPANILVTSDGSVKLLDFGIARLLTPEDDADAPPLTEFGGRAYTPDYASPEQLRGEPVGTRSDGYSLGVVLFELLTGTRPFDLRGKSTAETERVVAEQEPPRPSAAIGPGREAVLGERTGARLRSRLAGDLDAIILTALRKSPDRRYASAADFSQDLARHLDGRPVDARPEGWAYRFAKAVRRRKVESAAAAVAVVALAAGTTAAMLQARRADREGARATQVKEFLVSMLGAADPAALGRDVRVRDVLDSASVRAGTLADPDLEREIRQVIGGTYLGLGVYAPGLAEYQRAERLARQVAPGGSRVTAEATAKVSTALEFLGRYGEADSVLQVALAEHRRFALPNDPAEADYLDRRGRILAQLGRMAEAEPLFEEALAALRSQGASDSALAQATSNVAFINANLGRMAVAESLMTLAADLAERGLGPKSPLLAAILSPLATIQDEQHHAAAAESTFRRTIAMRTELLGPEHPDLAWSMFNYADFLQSHGRPTEAADWARRVLALRGRSLDDSHVAVGTSLSLLGRSLAQLDSLPAAVESFRESLAVRRRNLPAGHFLIATAEGYLGSALVRVGEWGEAERLLLDAEAMLAGTGRTRNQAEVRTGLVALYRARNRPAEADRWQARIDSLGELGIGSAPAAPADSTRPRSDRGRR